MHVDLGQCNCGLAISLVMKLVSQVDLQGDSSDVRMQSPVDEESGNGSADGAGAGAGPPALAQMTNFRKVTVCLLSRVCCKTSSCVRLAGLIFVMPSHQVLANW